MAGKFQVEIRPEYCKACGICLEVCPKKVLKAGKDGKAQAVAEGCIGCRLCEFHCPDFAISVRGGGKDEN